MKKYYVDVTYLPEMVGARVGWEWTATIAETAYSEVLQTYSLDSNARFRNLEEAKTDAKDITKRFVDALSQDRNERFEIEA